ncbi:MAG: chromate efflux transporter [Candidatus Rokubacteria bacterium]|nr:chromate efflux transporter [Candidatus Rokubacteria bacterium]
MPRVLEVFAVALRLGLTSFGGPVAHLGYFRDEYVARRKWLDEATYADLVALCQFLPGPASSQVGMAIGLRRAGLPGAIAAWLGFTLPSAIALVAFAYGLRAVGPRDAGWLHGLKIVAVAVVAQAVWGMARSLAPDRPRATLAALAAIAMLVAPGTGAQIGAIVVAGAIGWWWLPPAGKAAERHEPVRLGRRAAAVALVLFFVLLALLPILAYTTGSPAIALVDRFYRVGSLVFGGGHVVLPLLRAEVVGSDGVSDAAFVAGYGAAQAVPGPLFTFAAYLGAMMRTGPSGLAGATLALVAVFLPSLLLVVGALPFWDRVRAHAGMRSALAGVNAAVVGLLLAALYEPVWTSAIDGPADLALALAAFVALAVWSVPPWLVVLATAGAAALLG